MNKFQKTRHALSRMLDRTVIRLLGHKCEKCESRNTEYHPYKWARGWNYDCGQAYGAAGCYCNKCRHITWDTPLAEHMATLPNWDAGMEWAQNKGGDLPDRIEQAMLFAYMPEEFKKEAYWSNTQHAVNSNNAWYHNQAHHTFIIIKSML